MINLILDKKGGINKGDIDIFETENKNEVYVIQLTKQGQPYNLTGKTVELSIIEKKRKYGDMLQLQVEDAVTGKVRLEIVSDITKQDGAYDFQMTVKGTEDFIELFPVFRVDIKNNISTDLAGTIVSSPSFTILNDKLEKVTEWDAYFAETSGKLEEKYTTRLNELNTSLENKANYVTYEQFGAKGDGVSDDGEAIFNTHIYANANNVPVKSIGKTYFIANKYNIPIQTNVDWNNSTIIVDESKNSNESTFIIKSKYEPISIDLANVTTPINKNTRVIPELSNLGRVLLIARNSNKNIYYRVGTNADSGTQLNDFCVLNYGNLEVTFDFDFDTTTSITAYKIDKETIEVKNANFISNIIKDTSVANVRKGIRVNRSNVIIDNVNHNINELADSSMSSGFYIFEYCTDVCFKNSRIIPRKCVVPGVGTYEIQMYNTCNLTLSNIITSDLADDYWGVIGANYNKNVSVINCKLNRFDCHKALFGNTIIKDTEIGVNGITINGGGLLKLENVKTRSKYVINFRDDYGSSWDGDIEIINVKHRPTVDDSSTRLFFIKHVKNHDFGLDCCFGKNNVKVDGYELTSNLMNQRFPLLKIEYVNGVTTHPSSNDNVYKIAKNITFKNCTITNITSGFCLLETIISDLRAYSNFEYVEEKNIDANSKMIKINPNVVFNVDNVQFNNNNVQSGSLIHTQFQKGFQDGSDDYLTVLDRIVPRFNIKNCIDLRCHVFALPSEVNIDNCNVIGAYANSTGTRSKYTLKYSEITAKGNTTILSGTCFRLNRCSTFFDTCNFYKPIIDDVVITAESDAIKFKNAYNFFSNMTVGKTAFNIYCNFNNCMFGDLKIETLVNNTTVIHDLTKIGDGRYNVLYKI